MIPGIIDQEFPAPFLYPKNILTNIKTSLHIGGIAIGDSSYGYNYQAWRLEVSSDNNHLILSSGNTLPITVVTDIDIEECSLSFDQNLNPVYAWVSLGVMKLRWFDSRINEFTITEFSGRSPYVVIDDSNEFAVGFNDVIFSYFLGNALYYRVQREFYEVPHLVRYYSDNGRILRCGMQENLRFCWELLPFS